MVHTGNVAIVTIVCQLQHMVVTVKKTSTQPVSIPVIGDVVRHACRIGVVIPAAVPIHRQEYEHVYNARTDAMCDTSMTAKLYVTHVSYIIVFRNSNAISVRNGDP